MMAPGPQWSGFFQEDFVTATPYSELLRPLLFGYSKNDPERAHEDALSALAVLSASPTLCGILERQMAVRDLSLRQKVLGLDFRNPVGLAGGFDKNGTALPALQALGYGFLEVGTVVPLPQPGNDRPRIYRIPEQGALINRMGFPSEGASKVRDHIARIRRRLHVPLFINISKNKETPAEVAFQDYMRCMQDLWDLADAFVVNISSPNTPGLRDLALKDGLVTIIVAVQRMNSAMAERYGKMTKPVLVKISPDMADEQCDDIIEVMPLGFNGFIATNTTVSRQALTRDPQVAGGLSGEPLHQRALHVVRYLRERLPNTPIVGVGGAHTPTTAIDFFRAGADLVQLYTGSIYYGPTLCRDINRELAELLHKEGIGSVTELTKYRT